MGEEGQPWGGAGVPGAGSAAGGLAAPKLAAGRPDRGPGGRASCLHRAWAGTPAGPWHPQCRLPALEPQLDADRRWLGWRAASASPSSVSLKVLTDKPEGQP